jgi:error-prone DNA polymerase
MGFYSAATLVQDARRHGLRVRPPDAAVSAWRCTVEDGATVRLGLRQVRGLREDAVRHMLAARAQRPFASLDDFLARTCFSKPERRALAAVGALNALAGHRRAAAWSVEEEAAAGDLPWRRADAPAPCPLPPMTLHERVGADFAGMGLTTGDHPMKLVRDRLPGVARAADLAGCRGGETVTIAGAVTCRQRPGTAKGVVFVTLEDETGLANAVVESALFERRRLVVTQEPFLRITGRLQIDRGVIHVRAVRIDALVAETLPAAASHDFH